MMSAGEELSIMSPSRTGAVDIMCTWGQEEENKRVRKRRGDVKRLPKVRHIVRRVESHQVR
jgi:hypothetical protein